MSEINNNTKDDAELISAAKNGDAEAFGVLYERYIERIFRYLRLRLSDDRDAEDLTETVFVRTFQAMDRYEDRGWPFSAYLYQVARNVLADHYRTVKQTSSIEKLEPLESASIPVDDVVVQRERIDLVREAMEELPEDYQEVIRLRVILKIPTAETAQWLGRTEGAIRVLLYRALRRLRTMVAKMSEESDG